MSVGLFSAESTGPIFTKILHDIVALVALLNHAYTRRYPITFLNARATKVGVFHFFTKLIAIAMYLEISEKEVQIDHLHPERFYSVKRLRKSVQYSRRYLTKYASFLAVAYQMFTNELCKWAHWDSDILFYFGMPVWWMEFAIFFTKLVAMAMPLEISEKEVQIEHLHPKRFHSVKRLRKSV